MARRGTRGRKCRLLSRALLSACALGAVAAGPAQASQQVLANVSVGPQAQQVAVSEPENRFFVNYFDFGNGNLALKAFDGSNHQQLIGLAFGGGYQGHLAVNPPMGRVYMTGLYRTVYYYDAVTGYGSFTLDAPNATPKGIAVNTVTNRIYTSSYEDATLSVIDGATNTVTDTVQMPAGSRPMEVAVNDAANRVYVTAFNEGSNPGDVYVYDGTDNSLIATVPVGRGAQGLAADSVSGRVYAANLNDHTVTVIDGGTNTVSATVAVGNFPGFVAVDRERDTAYVTDPNGVSVIDGSTATVSDTIALPGGYPLGIAVNSLTHRAYVAQNSAGSVAVIGEASANTQPSCPDLSRTVDRGQSISFTPGCTDADGDPLTYSIVSGPSLGSISGSPDGNATYTASGGIGTDSFTYKASDGNSDSNTATVTIEVTDSDGNVAPVCPDLTELGTQAGQSISLSGNCTDADPGDQLGYSIVSGPSNGSINGFSYVPADGFTGVDSFTYRANDGLADSNVGSVRVVVADPANYTELPAGGGQLSTGSDATPADPVVTTVESPVGGAVAIFEGADSDPTPGGYTLFGQAIGIEAPDAPDATNPLRLSFRFDPSVVDLATARMVRNGTPVPDCDDTSGTAAPDPCQLPVESAGDDALLAVLTTRSSIYQVAMASETVRFGPPFKGGVLKEVDRGDTVPLKVELLAGATEVKTGSLTLSQLDGSRRCPSDTVPVEHHATLQDGGAFRFKKGGDRWRYELSTKTLKRGLCYRGVLTRYGRTVGQFHIKNVG